MTRVLVVDDHPVFRSGLAALLASAGYEVVAEAASASEAVALARQHRPDLVMMDLGLPDGSGIDATAQITGELPETRVVVVTLFDDQGSVREALRNGATGYLVKDATPAQILSVVRAVELGATALGSGAAELPGLLTEPAPDCYGLTPRERQIAELLAKGLPNRTIAARLGLAGKTVANNVSAILLKLGVGNRVDAAHLLREDPSR